MRRRAILALLPLFLLSGCVSMQQLMDSVAKPTARLLDVQFTSLSLESLGLNFVVEVSNPMSVAIPLLDIDVALASAGTPFLSGAAEGGGVIAAGGARSIDIPVQVGFAQLISAIAGIRPGAVVPYRAEFGIGLDVPGIGLQRLPIAHDGEMPVPAVPKVDVGNFSLSEIGLTRVGGTATIDIENTNAFAVALSTLDLGLSLSGREVAGLDAKPGTELAPGQTTQIELPLGFSPLELGSSILDVLRGSSTNYGLAGSMKLGTRFGDFDVPLNVLGEAPIGRTR